MNKLRFALVASLLMTVACSSIGLHSEPRDQVRAVDNTAEYMNEIVKLKQENITLIKDLSAAIKRNIELETMLAERVKQQSIEDVEVSKQEEVKSKQVIQNAFRAASADVDIYHLGADQETQQLANDAILQKGFMPHYPVLPKGMGVASSTTVFYYDDSFKPVAADLVKALTVAVNSGVKMIRGASPYGKNKLIVHIVGSD